MRVFADRQRHLVCWPFSVELLHAMARAYGISRSWFHGGKRPHYDIPKHRIDDILQRVEVVSPRVILSIIKGETPP